MTGVAIRRPRLAADLAVVGLPLAVLYLSTVSRDLGTVDSGELAAAAASMGVAHPTGYPLYLLLGRLFILGAGTSPIFAMNLLSVVAALGAALAVTALARAWIRWSAPADRISVGADLGAWSAGLLFGTNAVFWEQAAGNEVYALHLLFIALLLRQALCLARGVEARDLVITAWLVGLSVAHHLSIVFIAPAMAAAILAGLMRPEPGRRPASLRAWGVAAALFVFAWSLVLVLPLRSAREPLLDWGDPERWDGFWRHILAAQYRVWLFESGAQWSVQLRGWMTSLPSRLAWPALALIPLGLWAGRRRGRGGLVLGLALIVTVAWASSYSIHDLAPYYLPADLVLTLLVGAGLAWLATRYARLMPVVAVVALAVVGLQAGLRFGDADRSDDHFIRFHTEATLRLLPERTVLLSRFWDAVVSPSIYLQQVEGQRPDVTVVDPELLRRSWYYPQLRRTDPALLPPIEPAVGAFLEQVALFESGRPYDVAVIEGRYQSVLRGIAQAHRPGRSTAFTADVEGTGFHGAAAAVPEGLVYLLRDGPEEARVVDPPDVAGLLRAGYRPADRIHRLVVLSWTHGVSARIRFLEAMGRQDEIEPWREAARRLAPVADEARRREVTSD